jgi:hypothetical protein
MKSTSLLNFCSVLDKTILQHNKKPEGEQYKIENLAVELKLGLQQIDFHAL